MTIFYLSSWSTAIAKTDPVLKMEHIIKKQYFVENSFTGKKKWQCHAVGCISSTPHFKVPKNLIVTAITTSLLRVGSIGLKVVWVLGNYLVLPGQGQFRKVEWDETLRLYQTKEKLHLGTGKAVHSDKLFPGLSASLGSFNPSLCCSKSTHTSLRGWQLSPRCSVHSAPLLFELLSKTMPCPAVHFSC